MSDSTDYKSISIVIPAYNEEKTLAQLLGKVVEADLSGLKKEIIVVNDGSKDSTEQVAEKFAQKNAGAEIDFKVLTNAPNRGKTQTVKRGVLESTGDLVVVQDADLEYDPSELGEFVKLFIDNPELDVVYGNRFGKKNKVIYWQNYIGNKFLTFVSNLFTFRHGFWLKDMEVCYKMVRGDIFRGIAPHISATSNFGLEPEVTARLARYRKQIDGKKKRLKLKQLSISYYPRSIEEGKHMKAYKDGLKALGEILRYNLF